MRRMSSLFTAIALTFALGCAATETTTPYHDNLGLGAMNKVEMCVIEMEDYIEAGYSGELGHADNFAVNAVAVNAVAVILASCVAVYGLPLPYPG